MEVEALQTVSELLEMRNVLLLTDVLSIKALEPPL